MHLIFTYQVSISCTLKGRGLRQEAGGLDYFDKTPGRGLNTVLQYNGANYWGLDTRSGDSQDIS